MFPKDAGSSPTLVSFSLSSLKIIKFLSFVPCTIGLRVGFVTSVSDMGNNKRRLLFSTAQKEIAVTPLHAKIPLTVMKRAMVSCIILYKGSECVVAEYNYEVKPGLFNFTSQR